VIRAVIDTNVLVSGLLSPAGNEELIVFSVPRRLCTARSKARLGGPLPLHSLIEESDRAGGDHHWRPSLFFTLRAYRPKPLLPVSTFPGHG
jgi:hypothetical protein